MEAARLPSPPVPRLEKEENREVIRKIMDYAQSIGFDLCALEYSPIKGPEGNIEYLVHLKKDGRGTMAEEISAAAVVAAAHGELDKEK